MSSALNDAVKLVLPAVNVAPGTTRDDDELSRFLWRAFRDNRTRIFAIPRHRTASDEAVHAMWPGAVALVPESCLPLFESLIVCWVDKDAASFAFASIIGLDRQPERLLAASWLDPSEWENPRFPLGVTGRAALDLALQRVAEALDRAATADIEASRKRLVRATRLVDVALRSMSGEAQLSSDTWSRIPTSGSEKEQWLAGYRASVEDEWRRITGGPHLNRDVLLPANASRTLADRNIFLSYARSDGANVAWPVYGALRAAGATVWFDQVTRPDQEQLDNGFLDVIQGCDTYVACATNEFFERAGYAVQELAWALQLKQSGSGLRIVTIVEGDACLPTCLKQFPVVRMVEGAQLQQDLEATLTGKDRGPVIASPSISSSGEWLQTPIDRQARAVHALRLSSMHIDDISQALIDRLSRSAQKIRASLKDAHVGLNWDGSLDAIESWPADSLIRDVRFRLATMRTVVGVAWPFDDPSANESLARTVEVLATQSPPPIHWANIEGWDDIERRYSLRHHLSFLRLLCLLLDRGVYAGIVDVRSTVVDAWRRQLDERRVELLDALLSLRLGGNLSWQKDPPDWASLHLGWRRFLNGAAHRPLFGRLAPAVAQVLLATNEIVAPAVADLIWRAMRQGGTNTASLGVVPYSGGWSIQVTVCAPSGVSRPEPSAETLNILIVLDDASNVSFTVDWGNAGQFSLSAGNFTATIPTENYIP